MKNEVDSTSALKRQLETIPRESAVEDLEAKRRRILEESRDIDADSDGGIGDESSEDDRQAAARPKNDCG